MDELEQMGNSSRPPLRPVITARLYREGKCFGPGVAMLLRRVRTLRSLRAASLFAPAGWLPQVIAVAAVVVLHLWKHNNLLSIFGGTILYMVLVQAVFV